jgi:AraC-like DNA-binding protein
MAYELRGLFDRAVAILEGNPRQSIKAVSQALRVERHTLEKAFWLSAGKSFRQFRRDAVLARAKELLASRPNVPVKEIAFLLGYSSERAFARFIRKALGCSPCELRRALLGLPQPPAGSGRRGRGRNPTPARKPRVRHLSPG